MINFLLFGRSVLFSLLSLFDRQIFSFGFFFLLSVSGVCVCAVSLFAESSKRDTSFLPSSSSFTFFPQTPLTCKRVLPQWQKAAPRVLWCRGSMRCASCWTTARPHRKTCRSRSMTFSGTTRGSLASRPRNSPDLSSPESCPCSSRSSLTTSQCCPSCEWWRAGSWASPRRPRTPCRLSQLSRPS